MAEQPLLRIAIVGAGVAGLGAAIALKHHPGIEVQLYERATEMREIGASIALGPNGMRTLDRLGVHNALDEATAFRNASGYPMIYRHYKTNEVVSVDKHDGPVDYRHRTARFYRAHLQKALLQHIEPSKLHLGKFFRSVTFDDQAQELVITFTDETSVTADVLLGADGIHSPIRTFFVPSSRTAWTGWVTFRSVFPISNVVHIPELPDEATHYWGPNRMLFISQLGKDAQGQDLFTVVGSYQSDPDAEDAPYRDAQWNEDGDVDVLRRYYNDWGSVPQAIIDATPHTRIYPNAAADGLETWVLGGGRVTLAGDAAHAHGGAFAAGGSLALDDGWAFAAAIEKVFPVGGTRKPSHAEIGLALKIYERTRKPHTDKVIQVVHAGNKSAVARLGKVETDEELRARMKGRASTAWIHEHNVQATFAAAVVAELGASEKRSRL